MTGTVVQNTHLLMALAKGQSFFTSQFSLLDLYIHSLKVDGDKGVVWH